MTNHARALGRGGAASPERTGTPAAPGDRAWRLWLLVAAIGVHIIEEYALNFAGWSEQALGVRVPWEDFHLVNAGVIVYAIACAAIGWRLPAVSLSSASLVILNAVGFHGAFTLAQGFYSPGTASALLLFVPAGAAAYAGAARDGVLAPRVVIVSGAAGLLWHLFLGGVFAIRYFWPLYR